MPAPELAAGEVLPLSRRIAVHPEPGRLFDRLVGGADRARDVVLLESADDSAGSGGQSLMVVRSALRATCHGRQVRLAALTAAGRAVLPWLADTLAPRGEVQRDEQTLRFVSPEVAPATTDAERLRAPSTLDVLRQLSQGWQIRSRPAAAPLQVAGCLAYDLIDQFETLPESAEDPLGFPDWVFWLPESVVRLDHRQGTCTILSHAFGGGGEALYHDAVSEVERLVAACEDPDLQVDAQPDGPVATAPADTDTRVDLTDAQYGEAVRTLKQRIVAGDVFQIVPSRTFRRPCAAPFVAYRRLRRLNPSPYMFFVQHGDWTLFGASPETCVKVVGPAGEQRVTIKPIAGTRPRGLRNDGGLDPDLDTRLEAELRQDRKEQAEHLMLVDLARNDVARVSQPGTRQVERLLTVERYSHVMHLVSRVTGQLRPDLDALHAYAATLNMGTLVGAPKLRAAQLLRETEGTKRGPYGGAVGYVTCDGEFDSCIVIRSALVQGGVAHVRSGAGVVHDSQPAAEAAETRRKADAVLAALRTDGRAP